MKGDYILAHSYNYTPFLSDSCILYSKEGKLITQKSYGYINEFSEGLAVVCANGLGCINQNAGFIDENGNEIIPLQYNSAKSFSEGLAAVKREDKWGYINKAGEIIIPFKYTQASSFSNGIAEVSYNGFSQKINYTGEMIEND